MRRIEEMRAAVVEHGAPASCRRGYAEAQEAHSGLGENSARHADRRLHDHRLNDVGQNMVNDNAQIACAESACGLHEFALARVQHLRTNLHSVAVPTSNRKPYTRMEHSRPSESNEDDGKQNSGTR